MPSYRPVAIHIVTSSRNSGIVSPLSGDMNNDGELTVTDITRLVNAIVKK